MNMQKIRYKNICAFRGKLHGLYFLLVSQPIAKLKDGIYAINKHIKSKYKQLKSDRYFNNHL
jgi:hypothetical protein